MDNSLNFSTNAKTVLTKRYLKKDNTGKVIETPKEMLMRVAKAIASVEKNYGVDDKKIKEIEKSFYEMMKELEFMPNSPTLMNAGKEGGQLAGCFVLNISDSMESIFDTIKHTALIHKSGGGTGFDFSHLRPKDSIVGSSGGTASGPISFLKVFDAATEAVKQSNTRRGANMGILRVDHPDILEFIKCKEVEGVLSNFNISVAMTDDFMDKVLKNENYNLIAPHTNKIVKELNAKEVFDVIAEKVYNNGEPGVIFIDKMDKYNPTPNLGKIEATNPCVIGSTLVATADGRDYVSIQQLAEEGKDIPVYCYGDGAIQIRMGRNPRKTRQSVEVWKVILDDDSYIIGTKDHKFISRNTKEIKLEDLKIGESLMPFRKWEYKVKSVEFYGCEDVYNITIDEFHTVAYVTNPNSQTRITKNRLISGIVTRQCGETGLLPKESCNLGSINLTKMLKINKNNFAIDWKKLKRITQLATRFLDNVIDANCFPLPEIKESTLKTRKIGLGIMGWATMIGYLEIPYDSKEAINLAKKVMGYIQKTAHEESIALAKQKGVFPAYEGSTWANKDLKVRNATLTTIAPTGTISIIAGPTSSGIEPNYHLAYFRNVLDGERLLEVDSAFEYIAKKEGFYSKKLMKDLANGESIQNMEGIPINIKKIFKTAMDIAPIWHIKTQAAFQQFTDNAVSKTINLNNNATIDDIKKAYLLAYKLGCKGITLYRDGSRKIQVLTTDKKVIDKVIIKHRPEVVSGTTTKIVTGCGNLYVTVNKDENGNLVEMFTQIGKAGGCAGSQLQAIGRLVSLALRGKIGTEAICKQLKGIRCPSPSWDKGKKVFSCADAIAIVLSERAISDKIEPAPETIITDIKPNKNMVGVCKDCGSALRHQEGCLTCDACGYSKC